MPAVSSGVHHLLQQQILTKLHKADFICERQLKYILKSGINWHILMSSSSACGTASCTHQSTRNILQTIGLHDLEVDTNKLQQEKGNISFLVLFTQYSMHLLIYRIAHASLQIFIIFIQLPKAWKLHYSCNVPKLERKAACSIRLFQASVRFLTCF